MVQDRRFLCNTPTNSLKTDVRPIDDGWSATPENASNTTKTMTKPDMTPVPLNVWSTQPELGPNKPIFRSTYVKPILLFHKTALSVTR